MNDDLPSILDLEPPEPPRPLRRKEAIAAQQERLRTLSGRVT
jgi:hypothetical protein